MRTPVEMCQAKRYSGLFLPMSAMVGVWFIRRCMLFEYSHDPNALIHLALYHAESRELALLLAGWCWVNCSCASTGTIAATGRTQATLRSKPNIQQRKKLQTISVLIRFVRRTTVTTGAAKNTKGRKRKNLRKQKTQYVSVRRFYVYILVRLIYFVWMRNKSRNFREVCAFRWKCLLAHKS